MSFDNLLYASLCIVLLWSSAGLSFLKEADEFPAFKCSVDEDCDSVCFRHETLYNRCDLNGTCVCDCSDKSIANSSYTSACAGRQPDGDMRTDCDTYCSQEYLRPCRFCNFSVSQCYPTCVCKSW